MDAETLHKFRSGDHKTFNTIMTEYQQPIYYFLYRMTGNEKDAEDLTQEAFVKAYLERENFRGDSAINTWIYRIAANLARNHLRWHALRRYIPIDSIARLFASGEETSSREEVEYMEKSLLKFLPHLPPKQRLVFILKYFHRLTHAEIARIAGISMASSKTNFHYAVNTLKQLVE